jgi:hypothetical protein
VHTGQALYDKGNIIKYFTVEDVSAQRELESQREVILDLAKTNKS